MVADAPEINDTFMNLGSIHYPVMLIVVCRLLDKYDTISWPLYRYKCTLPHYQLFKPTTDLSVADAMNAGLQFVKTPYFCVLREDMVHWSTFEHVLSRMVEADSKCTTVRAAHTTHLGWATQGPHRKAFWSTEYVLSHGGFKPAGDNRVVTIEAELMKQLPAADRLDMDELLVFGKEYY